MRVLLFSGKGGVGKTSLAAATGVRLAELGYRTLVMSVDPAHSLADCFDLEAGLFAANTADPCRVANRLWIQEVNVQKEIKRHWRHIWVYISSLLQASGLNEIEAEELAIFPGMEELSALLYVNMWYRERRYDVIVLDCAPTAESLRFVSMPTTLKWYMKKVFPAQRGLVKAVGSVAKYIAPFELPPDSYFTNVEELFNKIDGIDEVLDNPKLTSVRLVTNAEQLVVRETRRAFVYFSLHGLTVDQVIVNRVLPEDLKDDLFREWIETQQRLLKEMDGCFAPVPVRYVPFSRNEILGYDRIKALAASLFARNEDPAAVTRTERPYVFRKTGGRYEVRLQGPFAANGEVSLFRKDDQLVIDVGVVRRHVGLPTSMSRLETGRARLVDGVLVVEFQEDV